MTACTQSERVSSPPSRDRVELILCQLDRLPPLPSAASRLFSVTASGESAACDVVEIMEVGTALNPAMLRLVRRADPAMLDQVITAQRAVALLGVMAARNAALSLQLYETFSRPDERDPGLGFRKELWRHSLAVACAAEMISERTAAPSQAGEAFVCGLLHDIGKAALDACLPKSYARVVERVERQLACICDIERDILGLDHTIAGKRLTTRWRLPQAVVECVWLHHQSPDALPSSLACRQLVHIVHLVDNLVRREGIGYSGYRHVGDLEEIAAACGLVASKLVDVCDRLPERLEPFEELIGLDEVEPAERTEECSASLVQANKHLAQCNAGLIQSNRQLEVRSACFLAIEHFISQVRCANLGEFCVAAAQCIRTMLAVDRAVAFFGSPTGRWLQVGRADASEQRGEFAAGTEPAASVIVLDESCDVMPSELLLSLPPVRGFTAAAKGCEIIWERCMGSPPDDPLWMLPIINGDGLPNGTANQATGAVLVAATETAIHRLRSAPQECHVMSRVMGMAAGAAGARVQWERMNDELLDLNRRICEAQTGLVRDRSISMIAEMAAGAAHELNNPLSVISGRAQMELAECDDEDSARALKVIMDQTQRAAQIVTDLMNFAKPGPPDPVSQRLAEVLEPLCQHWRGGLRRADQLILSLADPKTFVYADPTQLRDILDAVLANALEATNPETARVQINSPSHASDETVRIVVEDNGVGMTREVLEHAFDPFFSSRPAGRGRGLGLSRAYRFAEINGGRLWLESRPNVGTTVALELPARPPTS